MRADPLDHARRRRVPEPARVDDVGPVHHHAQLPEAASLPAYLERRVGGQLRRHPGGDEGLAESDGAVVDLDSMHAILR